MSVPVAVRQLQRARTRTIAGVLGIAAALLLPLALNSIFAGMQQRLTAYLRSTGADVVVAERGVTTMHMTQSALEARQLDAVARVAGVSSVRPIRYASAMVVAPAGRGLVYLIGAGATGITRPFTMGRAPGVGEIAIDAALARSLKVEPGDVVVVLGRRLRVSGEFEGTASIASSVAFVPLDDMASVVGAGHPASYAFVDADQGVSAAALARRIDREVPGAEASTLQAFVASERRVVSDMATDIVQGMVLTGVVIGIAVTGLLCYTLTLAQLRDLVVLRAIGMSSGRAIALALEQTAMVVSVAFAFAAALDFALVGLLPRLSPTLAVDVRVEDVLSTAALAALVAITGSLLPVWRIVTIDPAAAFRR